MKKLILTLIIFTTCTTLFALDLSSVKSQAKDQAKSKAGNQVVTELTTKLNKVQNDKGPILFKTGSAEIEVDKCKKTLDTLVSIIQKSPENLKVRVDGHTDNVGNSKKNLQLSQKRAESVVKWLVKEGKVAENRLSAKGFGDKKPIADNKTAEGQAKNRRVEFTVSQ